MTKILLISDFSWTGSLAESYRRAFEELKCHVTTFDINQAVHHFTRFGRLGQLFNSFVPIEPWIRKANREMVTSALSEKPDVVLVFGSSPVRAGALAQIKTTVGSKIVFVWPDPLTQLSDSIITTLPLYDLVATFSLSTISTFRLLGASSVEWIPLAGDLALHGKSVLPTEKTNGYGCDISFIGNWRSERAEVLAFIGALPGVNLKIWGSRDWVRFAGKNPIIQRTWQGRPIVRDEFIRAVRSSKINFNLIDQGIPMSPNMRFFEIPTAGGLQLCSACPEMESDFKHGESIFYYHHLEELPDLIKMLLGDDALRQQVAHTAHQKILDGHTYTHRGKRMLNLLGWS